MSDYSVIPGGPSPEMNPGCSGPFIILDPESACLYVWDDFAKQYVAFCLDDSGDLCDVDEIPLDSGTLVLTCTPGLVPQEGKASVFSLLTAFFAGLCGMEGIGAEVLIIENPGPVGEGTWCVQVNVKLGPSLTVNEFNEIIVNLGDGGGGIITNPSTGELEIDVCPIEDAVLGNILDAQLCDVKLLGQYIGQGSVCLTRNFSAGELTGRVLLAGANITIDYDPATCISTITGADAPPVALTPGSGTVPGPDGSSLDLDICGMSYVGPAPDGSRTVICTGGETVLADYVAGGGAPGGSVIVVGGGEGIDIDTLIVDGDITYTISLDLCDVPTSTLTELQNATNILVPLCVDGLSRKYSSADFKAAIVPTIQAGEGISVVIAPNPGGSDNNLISLDACGVLPMPFDPNATLLACSGSATVTVPSFKPGDGITIDPDGTITNDLAGQTLGAPTGSVMPFAGTVVPAGWLFCNGATLLISAYPDLFPVIGITYGGDATSFRVPDMRGRNPRGVNNMGGSEGPGYPGRTTLGAVGGSPDLMLLISNMPSHTHTGVVDAAGGHTHTGSTTSSGSHAHTTTGGGGNHRHSVAATAVATKFSGNTSGPNNLFSCQNYNLNTGYAGSHSHNVTSAGSNHSHALSISAIGDHTHGFTTSTSGGGTPIEQASPFIDLNYIIKE